MKILLIFTILIVSLNYVFGTYYFGTGISDITGPVTEINMMGYANPDQIDSGIHLRLFSRAYIIKDTESSRPIVFVSIDAGMTSQIVKTEVVNRLKTKFGKEYDHQNVMISATHTHSGPAGYFEYLLFTITSFGFVKKSYIALVDGIVASITMAHLNIDKGEIFINKGLLLDASINRSPASYLRNPLEERQKYLYNVDKEMTLLKFVNDKGQPVAMLNWFAVHGVSMNNTNKLISSDNKGFASILFEKRFNKDSVIGKGPFVAAFAQANEGDVSPNINGPKCIDTGLPCDFIHSTCNGKVENCIAFGPGKDMFESTKIIAQRQFQKAWDLFNTANTSLKGPISSVHQFVDMTNVPVNYIDGKFGTTCKPAMGFSFAAGTTDGPGAFDFAQGTLNGSKFWNIIKNFIKTPSPEITACQAPKPILLATGEITFPYSWQPNIVETQVFRLGDLLIAGVPGEFTTMSGRRVRASVEQVAAETFLELNDCQFTESNDNSNCKQANFTSVIGGLSNVYSDYIATYEEYQLQRYEGASTIYGPHTLQAYVEQYAKLTRALIEGTILPSGPTPPFFVDKLWSFVPGVVFDTTPYGKKYGDVLVAPKAVYSSVNDIVKVVFVSANPRNNLRLGDTFLTVESLNLGNGLWDVRYTDADWETKFVWSRKSKLDDLLGRSRATIEWTVSDVNGKCTPGIYRIRHFGTQKNLIKKPKYTEFVGMTKPFTVTCDKKPLNVEKNFIHF